MNQLEQLFIPLENGDLKINKIELGRHPLLKPIIAKTKTKEQVDKLMYIYLMADIGSMYNHLLGDEKHEAVKAHLGYDNLWKPTPDLNLAVETYSTLVDLTPTGRAYKTALKAVYETGKDLEAILEMIILLKHQLETRIKNVKNNTAFTESERLENMKEARAFMMEIANTQKEVIKSIKEMPGLISIVNDLASKFAEENSTAPQIHGGGTLGNRE